MNDRNVVEELNAFVGEAAAALDAISRSAAADRLVPNVAPGSPLACLVEQVERAAGTLPQPREPATWSQNECPFRKP